MFDRPDPLSDSKLIPSWIKVVQLGCLFCGFRRERMSIVVDSTFYTLENNFEVWPLILRNPVYRLDVAFLSLVTYICCCPHGWCFEVARSPCHTNLKIVRYLIVHWFHIFVAHHAQRTDPSISYIAADPRRYGKETVPWRMVISFFVELVRTKQHRHCR